MDIVEPVIRVGRYSGNNGPGFFEKSPKSTYEELQVDCDDYRIPSSSIAEARERIQQSIKKIDYNENLP